MTSVRGDSGASSDLGSGGEDEFGVTGSDDEGWTSDSGSDGEPALPPRGLVGEAPVPAALRAEGSEGEVSSDDEDIPEWERRERALHPELERVAMRPHTLAYKQAKMNDGSKFCRVSVGAGRLTPAERHQLRKGQYALSRQERARGKVTQAELQAVSAECARREQTNRVPGARQGRWAAPDGAVSAANIIQGIKRGRALQLYDEMLPTVEIEPCPLAPLAGQRRARAGARKRTRKSSERGVPFDDMG